MTKKVMVSRINAKMAEVSARMDELRAPNNGLSANTVKTQLQVKKTQLNNLYVIKALLKGGEFTEDEQKVFESLTTLTSERFTAVEVKKGDKLLDVLQKYPEKNYQQIMKAVEKAGLTIDYNVAGGVLK